MTGKTPAVSIWGQADQQVTAKAYPDQIKMLRNHSHLLKTEAQRFLMLGRMLHPLEFDAPLAAMQRGVQRGGKWSLESFQDRGRANKFLAIARGQRGSLPGQHHGRKAAGAVAARHAERARLG